MGEFIKMEHMFMAKNYSRRSFLKNLALGATILPIINTLRPSTAHAQTVPNVPLSESDPLATSMGYVADHKKVDKVKYPKKAAADGDKQLCKSCVLYLEGGKKIDGNAGEWGRCGLFQNGLVNANGWCNSFVAKVG